MSDVGCAEVEEFLSQMQLQVNRDGETHLKPLLMEACANLFLRYMCSTRFEYDDQDFKRSVRCFDEIFWEINQGYAVDFLPWLSPFYQPHMKKIESWTRHIRQFILNKVLSSREEKLAVQSEEHDDFTDALMRSLSKEENITTNTIIFMLEDFLGGHSAIGECSFRNVHLVKI
jgi:cytochrome P450 family 307 subfamily A